MGRRRIGIRFGGGSSLQNDTRMKVNYFNFFSSVHAANYSEVFNGWSGGKVQNYSDIFGHYYLNETTANFYPVINSFQNDDVYSVKAYEGLVPAGSQSREKYNIYRREYQVFRKDGAKKYGYYYLNNFYEDEEHKKIITPSVGVIYVDIDTKYYYVYSKTLGSYSLAEKARIYQGEWEPVLLGEYLNSIYDYNICNKKTYQYALFVDNGVPSTPKAEETPPFVVFANSDKRYRVWEIDERYPSQGKLIDGGPKTSSFLGAGVSPKWEDWSICELVPVDKEKENSCRGEAYKVDSSQIWHFRFSLETGSEKQNIARSDYQTLGQFPKIGYGSSNYASGDVSALMGSEIICGSKVQYVERLRASRKSPLSSNERAKMLEEWHKFVFSKNPKLLKDIKGQSWIVQIMSSENSVKNFYNEVPDTISFQWKQIQSTQNVMIYSETNTQAGETEAYGEPLYEPVF